MNLERENLGVEGIFFKNRNQVKVLQVKARHFNGLKVIVAIILSVAAGLSYSVVRLNDSGTQKEQENYRLQAQIRALQGEVNESTSKFEAVSASSDSSNTKALGYIESIQGKLKTINNYLGKRGLKGVNFHEINTSQASAKKNNNLQLYAKYNRYLEQLVDNVAMVPMGYPHISSFTSFFGYRGNPFDFGRNEFHPGLDFRGQIGDPVKCTASGKVIFTGRAGGYGNCVRIQHMNNVQTWYGHLSRINVHEGQRVTVGETIGRIGSTGRSTGPHLHYEVRRDGKPVNPVQYLTLNQ